MILRLGFDLPEATSYITHVRKTVCCLLESLGVSKEASEDIETLLGELATNAVCHAQGGGYTVEVEVDEERVTVIVTDRGAGFSPLNLPEPGTLRPDPLGSEEMPRLGGWGLPLVHSLADHVEILPTEPHGTTVRAEKLIR